MNDRILFASDLHVGAPAWGKDRADELRTAARELGDAGRKAGISVVVVGGDVFDSFRTPDNSSWSLAAELTGLLAASPTVKHVYILKGNHDWSNIGVWPDLHLGSPRFSFSVIDSPSWVDMGSWYLSFIPHLRPHKVTKGFLDAVAGALPPRGRPVLLCAHMAMEGSLPMMKVTDRLDEPQLTRETLSAYGNDLNGVFLGHIHISRSCDDYGVPVHYIGAPIRHSFAEKNEIPGGILASPTGEIQRVRTSALRLVEIRCDSPSEAAEKLSEYKAALDAGEMHLKLTVPQDCGLDELERISGVDLSTVVLNKESPDREPLLVHESAAPSRVSPSDLLDEYLESTRSADDTDESVQRRVLRVRGLFSSEPFEAWADLKNEMSEIGL